MKPSNISMVSFFFFNLVLFAAYSTSTSTNVEPFLECLDANSNPTQPISQAIYFPTNSSFSYVLQFYMRNLLFNDTTIPKPQLILTALHASHIQAAAICAKSHGLEMRIRSGGHDFEGLSYVSNSPFFILDMFNLREINVNVEDETAWIQAGAILGEVYYRIAEESNVHAFAAGMCPTVGVGGQISGGGAGTLIRKYGIGADNVIDAIIVDANGRLLNRASMGEELFWAITGGGASSFGVVLAYKIRLVRIPPKVTVAKVKMLANTPNFTDIVYKYLHIVNKVHEDIYLKLKFRVVQVDQTKEVEGMFTIFFLGDSEKLISLMKEIFPELGLTKADCVETRWVQALVYWAVFSVETPTDILLNRVHPSPAKRKRKSDFLKKPIPKEGLESIFKKMKELEIPELKFFPLGGIMDNISSSAKPFPHRAGNIIMIEIAANWNEQGAEAANYYINMTRSLYEHMTPYVSKSREAYLNYRDIQLGVNHQGPDSYNEAKSTYGFKYFRNNFDRLVEIKSRVDPDNFFRNEQSIPVLPSIGSA